VILSSESGSLVRPQVRSDDFDGILSGIRRRVRPHSGLHYTGPMTKRRALRLPDPRACPNVGERSAELLAGHRFCPISLAAAAMKKSKVDRIRGGSGPAEPLPKRNLPDGGSLSPFFHRPAPKKLNRVRTHRALRYLILVILGICFDLAPAMSQQTTSSAQVHANRGLQLVQKGDLKGAESALRQAATLAPRNPLYLSDLGSVLRAQKKLEEALGCYTQALAIDPKNSVIRRNLALTQWDLGKLPEARKNLESVLSLQPGDKLATLMLGMVAESLKDYAAARRLLESVSDLASERPESVASLARVFYHTGEPAKARSLLKSAGSKTGVHPQTVVTLAQTALEAGDNETAEKLLISVRPSYPDPTLLGYSLATVQFRAGRIADSAKTLLELVQTNRANGQVYNLLGHCFQKQGRTKEAVGAFERAVEEDPAAESNYLDLLRLLAANNLWRPTLKLATQAVRTVPGSHTLYEVKGLSEIMLSFTDDAIRSYTRALELNPESAKATAGLAVAQSAAGLYQEAASTFEKGIREFPKDALHYQEYGLMLLRQAAGGDAAAELRGISLLETALSLDNSLSEPHYQLGNLALTKGQVQQAVEHLELAVKLEPNLSKIRFVLARAYGQLARADDAAKQLEAYRQLKALEEKSNPGFPAVGAQSR